MIRITTEPGKHDGDTKAGYQINLIRRETGTVYEGEYVAVDDESVTGSVECEVYKSIEKPDKFVLHGKWFQKGQYYWYARFFSLNFPD